MRAPSAAAAFKAQPILMLAAMRFLQDNYATLVDGDGLLLPPTAYLSHVQRLPPPPGPTWSRPHCQPTVKNGPDCQELA